MNDQDDAYQRATIREQRAEIDRLTADNAHLAEVVGTQSARLEAQARELAELRADVVALQGTWSGRCGMSYKHLAHIGGHSEHNQHVHLMASDGYRCCWTCSTRCHDGAWCACCCAEEVNELRADVVALQTLRDMHERRLTLASEADAEAIARVREVHTSKIADPDAWEFDSPACVDGHALGCHCCDPCLDLGTGEPCENAVRVCLGCGDDMPCETLRALDGGAE